MANIVYIPVPIPNLTETAVQGFARDSNNFYIADSNFSTSIESLKKLTIQGIMVEENLSPYTSLPSGNWKMNDCCVYEGLIYVAVSDRDSNTRLLVRYNKTDLTYNSHTDISLYFEFGASVCIGHTGNLFLVSFQTSSNINANRLLELTTAGAFVAYHPLNTEVLEMQGLCFDGSNYFISSSLADLIYEFDSSFTELNTFENTNSMTEIEGLEFFEGRYYTHDIQGVPFEFLNRPYTPIADTFPTNWQRIVEITGTTPLGNLSNNVMLLTEDNLPLEIWSIAQNGGEDLRACLNLDASNQIPLNVITFDTVNMKASLLVLTDFDIGSEKICIAYGTPNHTSESPPNGLFGRNTVLSSRSLSMWDGTFDATVNGETTSKQENTNNGFWVPSKGSLAPTGLNSAYFGDTQDTSWFEKDISNQQEYTMVVWYKAYAVDQSGNDIITFQEPEPSSNASFLIDDASPNDIGSFITGTGWMRSGVTRNIGNWQRIVLAVSNSALNRKMWINGVLEANESLSSPESPTRTLLRIAQRGSNSITYQTDADLAGIELINFVVDDNYAASEYINQLNTDTFWSTGIPQNILEEITGIVVYAAEDTVHALSGLVGQAISGDINYNSDSTIHALNGIIGQPIFGNTIYNADNTIHALSGLIGQPVFGSISYNSDNSVHTLAGLVGQSIIGNINYNSDSAVLNSIGIIGQPIFGNINYSLENTVISAIGTVGQAVSGNINYLLENTILNSIGIIGQPVLGNVNYVADNSNYFAFGIIGQNVVGLIDYNSGSTVHVANGIIGQPVLGSISYSSDNTTLSAIGTIGSDISGIIFYSSEDTILSAAGIIGQEIFGSVSYTTEFTELSAIGTVGQAIFGNISYSADNSALLAQGAIGQIVGSISYQSDFTSYFADGDVGLIQAGKNDISLLGSLTLNNINLSSSLTLDDINLNGEL